MTELLRNKFHENGIIPQDPDQLYNYLDRNHRKKIENLKKIKIKGKRILEQDQYELLFPKHKKTDSMAFDTSLFVILLKNIWPDDSLDTAHLETIRKTRNKIQHLSPNIDKNTFLDIFKKVTPSLIAFGCKPNDIENIKVCKLQSYCFGSIGNLFWIHCNRMRASIKRIFQRSKCFTNILRQNTRN